MNLKNKTFLTLGLLLGAGTGCLSAAEVTDWYPVTTENRPFVRWWWLGSAVDPEGLTYTSKSLPARESEESRSPLSTESKATKPMIYPICRRSG